MTTSIEKEEELINKNFEKLDLPEKEFKDKSFDSCKFNRCDLNSAKFINCKFVDCEFVDCNLSLVSIKYCTFSEVDFEGCAMLGINWADAKWPQVKLNSSIKFYKCNISHSSFFGLSLSEIVIESCKAHEVDFREADLSHANLAYTDFHESMFVHTKLNSADFIEAVNYNIDIELNEIKKAKFSFPEVVSLLNYLEIEIIGLD